MSMKITRLTTYWTADEADAVLSLLDDLRGRLWDTYGDEITALRRNATPHCDCKTDQTELPFDDDIAF